MADIELVIKIPEEAKRAFDNAENNELKCGFYDHGGVIASAIRNGTELPKGHGELKDAKQICQKIMAKLGIKDAGFLLPAEKDVFRVIEETEAVVEADKGEE